jgi:hypothetical protein
MFAFTQINDYFSFELTYFEGKNRIIIRDLLIYVENIQI